MIEDFLAISIVGALLSFAIDGIKNKFGTTGIWTKAFTIILAIIVGTGFVLLRQTAWWETILVTLGASSTVYALFLK